MCYYYDSKALPKCAYPNIFNNAFTNCKALKSITIDTFITQSNDIDWWELYDMQKDSKEMHNLYGQAEYEPIVKELKLEMLKLQEQYNDPVRFSPDKDKE